MKLDTALRIATPARKPDRPLSFFEFWPDWLFYGPVAAHWIALGIRYGDFSLPTAANPTMTAGGLCGESKAGNPRSAVVAGSRAARAVRGLCRQ